MSMDGNWPSGPLAAVSMPGEWAPDDEPVGPAGQIDAIPPAQQPAPQKVAQTGPTDTAPPAAVEPGHVTHFLVHHVSETMERGASQSVSSVFDINSSNPVKVLDRIDNRRRATILNDPDGATTIFVGADPTNAGAGDRFKLKPGASLTVYSRGPVYACYDTSVAANTHELLYVWSELNEPSEHILGAMTSASTAPESYSNDAPDS